MSDLERSRAGALLGRYLECEIHRYDIRSGEHQVLQFPEEVGCFALREKGVLLWRYAAVSGLPMPICCGAKSAITEQPAAGAL
jgi:hypothetical protein